MEAFKAANPQAKFCDFIHWHSPRDYDGQSRSRLSPRMADSSNFWHELWSHAKPVPVARQTRLFNYSQIAEEILQSLEMITIDGLATLMMPIIVKAVARQLAKHRCEVIRFCLENMSEQELNIMIGQSFLRLNTSQLQANLIQDDHRAAYRQLFRLELDLVQFHSTMKKFTLAYEEHNKRPFCEFYQANPAQTSTKGSAPSSSSNKGEARKVATLGARRQVPGGTSLLGGLSKQSFVKFILQLLVEPEVDFSPQNAMVDLIVRLFADSDRFHYEQSTSVGDRMMDSGRDDSKVQRLAQIKLPSPNAKEFIFRATGFARPACYSRVEGLNRMYTLLNQQLGDFRIATAFSEDTTFC